MPAADGRGAGTGAQVLILLAAVLAAYANALTASFQFDDWDVIVRDPRVQDLGAWWDSMPGIRPLLKLSYALNHAAGLGPAGFHGANVVVHGLNALLVWWLFRQRLAAAGTGSPGLAALAGALVFALHPVQTEAVTYASGRSLSLSTAFALGSLAAWVSGRQSGGRAALWIASPLLMAAAMATRETTVVLPLVLLAWAATDPGRPFRGGEFLRGSAGHWLLAGLALAVVLAWPRYQALVATGLGLRTPLENLAVQLDALRYLAGQLVLLHRLNADPVLAGAGSLGPAAVLTALLMATLVGLALFRIRRWPVAALAILWFFAWLLPTNSVLARLDVVNDRQLYVALAGPALLVAGLVGRWPGPARAGIAGTGGPAVGVPLGLLVLALVVVLVVVLGTATHLRNRVYATETAFWTDVVAKSPGSSRAHNNLGMAYAAECRLAEARAEWATAFRLDPGNFRAAINGRLLREGRLPAGLECPAAAFPR